MIAKIEKNAYAVKRYLP